MKKPPLGEIPYLPPKAYCEDHLGDRMSGPPCPNCRPLTEDEKVAHRKVWLALHRVPYHTRPSFPSEPQP